MLFSFYIHNIVMYILTRIQYYNTLQCCKHILQKINYVGQTHRLALLLQQVLFHGMASSTNYQLHAIVQSHRFAL